MHISEIYKQPEDQKQKQVFPSLAPVNQKFVYSFLLYFLDKLNNFYLLGCFLFLNYSHLPEKI